MESDFEPFECWNCGACCRMVGVLPEMAGFDRGDGACRHLGDDNLCGIYEDRPLICRVRGMWEEVHRFSGVSWEDHKVRVTELCVQMDEIVNGGGVC